MKPIGHYAARGMSLLFGTLTVMSFQQRFISTMRRGSLFSPFVFTNHHSLPSSITSSSSSLNSRLYMSTNPSGSGVDNIMNPNSYTEKAWENIQKLPQYGDKYGAQFVEAPILFKSLLDEGQGGLTQRILAKTGANINVIDKTLEDYLKRQPKVSDTSQKSLGKSMVDTLNKAQQIKKEFEDSFVSVEHLLMAVADTDSFIKKLLSDNNVRLPQLKEAVKAIRGSAKVTTRNAEASYESLKLYCRDLTEAAEQGKLDPVIGRDEEIRRTIQILSRRTKNNPILLGKYKWVRHCVW